jgi:hypothetical protein
MSGLTEVIWTDQNRTAGQPPDLNGGAVTLTCMRLRCPNGTKDKFHLAAARNLRKMTETIPNPAPA